VSAIITVLSKSGLLASAGLPAGLSFSVATGQ
jgi:hypothetical protein